ncbi:GTPase domain-containing protein [Lacicoccus alkaliphilus]|uniref:Small GTP-binding protein domain-containing protein n=1 Tax=Lacicoccus alkaliphilus DSM 16010 TaxID=1123231 RepID=A0A1M7EAV3_9BACL|nr:GTPase domain-containing protein [Salinicoccus alkaliphilus]SHL88489.1 small GTP-binding protein domain-containing protein [Salinicoccus alkaliphilus DSM 16010]
MTHQHPLVGEFFGYIRGTIDYRIAVAGQVDAGKSALINALTGEQSHISTETDATRDVTGYLYGEHSELLDFPGVGTKEFTPGEYKKLLKKHKVKHVLYVFSSKIREADENVIRFLAKKNIGITFVYSKLDALIDVSGAHDRELLKREKNAELHVTFKKIIRDPLKYHFISVKDGTGIDELKEEIDAYFNSKDEAFRKRAGDTKYFDKFLSKKSNALGARLLTPGFKDLILSREFKAIEQKTTGHFHIDESDAAFVGVPMPRVIDFVNEAKETGKAAGNYRKMIGPLTTLISTVLKVRKLNVITFILSTFGEAGVRTIYPVLKGVFEYVRAMNDMAGDVLEKRLKEHGNDHR